MLTADQFTIATVSCGTQIQVYSAVKRSEIISFSEKLWNWIEIIMLSDSKRHASYAELRGGGYKIRRGPTGEKEGNKWEKKAGKRGTRVIMI